MFPNCAKNVSVVVGFSFLISYAWAPLPNREERAAQPSVDGFLNRLASLLGSFQRFTRNHDISAGEQLSQATLGELEDMWQTMQTVTRHFENLAEELPADLFQPVEMALQRMNRYLRNVHQIRQNNQGNSAEPAPMSPNVTATTTTTATAANRIAGNRGASRYDITREQLETLLQLRMTLTEIARSRLLGTGCRNTLYNHCKKLNIQLPRERFTSVSEEDLRTAVREVNEQQPRSGSEEVRAILRTSRGLIVQRERVRRALAEVDPVGTACRWAQLTVRRSYSVKSPNSLWHLDNNHALKRWGIFIHGGVDGFSRTVTFLCAATSLTARTSLRFFLSGIGGWGLPSRIRLDRGLEYNGCEKYMVGQMGPDRGSALRGKSVHNQRIERLWRDVYTKVLDLFYRLFYYLEDAHVLDLNNQIHMMALHYTFRPRIQAALTRWANAHNDHGLRTAHHRSPRQIWTSSMIQQRCSLQAATSCITPSVAVTNAVDFRLENHTQEIIDEFDIDISDSADDLVQLPIDEADIQDLRQQVNPLRRSSFYGVDIYQEVVMFLCTIMHRTEQE